MNTGSQQFGRPSFGSWVTYGLGSETRDLPAFVVLSSGKKGPSGGNSNWGSGFLPTVYEGVSFRSSGDPVLYLSNPRGVDAQIQRESLDTIRDLNQARLDVVGDPEIATRINSFEMAYRMQSSAPELMDLSQGAAARSPTCTAPSRASRRSPTTVCWPGDCSNAACGSSSCSTNQWDQHGNLKKDLAKNCKDTDQACAALVRDLKQRGLLDETIVLWGGEFGRTPMVQGGGDDGRDHHPNAFTMWMAGGGLKPGLTLGQTDEFGFNVSRGPRSRSRFACHAVAPARLRSHQVDLPFPGPRFPVDRCAWPVVHKLLA